MENDALLDRTHQQPLAATKPWLQKEPVAPHELDGGAHLTELRLCPSTVDVRCSGGGCGGASDSSLPPPTPLPDHVGLHGAQVVVTTSTV